MRLSEFAFEDNSLADPTNQDFDTDADSDPNILTALSLLQSQIKTHNLKPEVPTALVLRYINNSGLSGFTYDDLISANQDEPAVKNLIKKITTDMVQFNTSSIPSVTNPEEYTSAVDNPEAVVSGMAKSAMQRRQ